MPMSARARSGSPQGVGAADLSAPGGGPEQRGQDPEQRGLAGAVGAETGASAPRATRGPKLRRADTPC